jgi:hypothetical protein
MKQTLRAMVLALQKVWAQPYAQVGKQQPAVASWEAWAKVWTQVRL